MWRRKRLALGALAALAIVALGLAVALLPKSPEREKFDRVQVGMTQAEVWEILGEGPADAGNLEREAASWRVRDGHILVEFDRAGRVTAKAYQAGGWFAEWRDWLATKVGL